MLTGHSSGSNLVSSPIFVSEISHPDLRGASSVLTMVCYTSGFFVSMLGGASLSWRVATLSYNTTSLLSLTIKPVIQTWLSTACTNLLDIHLTNNGGVLSSN